MNKVVTRQLALERKKMKESESLEGGAGTRIENCRGEDTGPEELNMMRVVCQRAVAEDGCHGVDTVCVKNDEVEHGCSRGALTAGWMWPKL